MIRWIAAVILGLVLTAGTATLPLSTDPGASRPGLPLPPDLTTSDLTGPFPGAALDVPDPLDPKILSDGASSPPAPEPPELFSIDDQLAPAVATYSIDPKGNLYELHSPRTEVPRLSPPKS